MTPPVPNRSDAPPTSGGSTGTRMPAMLARETVDAAAFHALDREAETPNNVIPLRPLAAGRTGLPAGGAAERERSAS